MKSAMTLLRLLRLGILPLFLAAASSQAAAQQQFSDDSPANAAASSTEAGLAMPASRDRVVVSTDGARIVAHEYGLSASEAPTIVLVHGYPDTSRVWDQVVARLAPTHHVVAYDTRGSGDSEHPSPGLFNAPYKLARLSADLNAVIDATSNGQPVHLVGHDWGSIQSWESVAKGAVASKIASYTSISGPSLDLVSHWARQSLLNPFQWGNLINQAVSSAYIIGLDFPVLPEVAWATGLPSGVLNFLVMLEGGTREPYQSGDGATALNLYRANVLERLLFPTYKDVAVKKIQLIVPTRDLYVKESTAVDSLNGVVADPRITRIQAGHWVQLSHPDEVAHAIASFVSR
ncbi:alpha/beta fold hydrolase [Burkholderia thailandensis]|uniref:Hydrolase, alpha/beta fold family, putative n=1 Tax=Burkholderia thailandensis (strain ATCC 700388 / DSM 13276 / CCUG 48851 / CIP 106301 / E264) TaxID=271848 RepID=Q2SW23_BURTA|nr:alpha/beta fold hydrolase [Burkholderia thailandensis]ABC37558.1 hydrolase, alpha/beta fold family, putative [Burkholderia thailandensis E264]AHI73342.1 alpha/beta hydrolase fold family protein [Burkholderia thailandensis 2002721723]AHI78809.1 alpha/beta hydrolase fold family protein [Burkholderia thailandensis E444]AIC87550.1 alpha/beta hydrolase fold family protein [Burkholderia thailandensis USAMRU Malaysia \